MITVHPNRYSTSRVVARKLGVVVHTTETGEDRLPVLLAKQTQPGTRTNPGSDFTYGSSYHAYADGENDGGSYVQILPATAGPYSAPPLNKTFWHISIPGWARSTRDEWLDGFSRDQIRGVAKFIADKHLSDGFPLERIGPDGLRTGKGGICGHVDVTYAFRQTDHTDPGPGFPWEELLADVRAFLAPKPEPDLEDDMMPAIFTVEGANAAFIQLPSTDHTIHVQWTGRGTPDVQAVYAGLQACGARVRKVPLSACEAWTIHGPLPQGDKREWSPSDFYAVV